MISNDVIKRLIERLEVYISRLEEMQKIPLKDFLNDWKTQDIVLRNFQIAVESCMDIGAHIISELNLKVPETYVQIVESLVENKILPYDFGGKFKEFVKFRNIIVHEYLYIDMKKVYHNLQNINNFREFIKYILAFLKS
ncbi:MAG: type VII toxin-antitoxin system HepT family RNase toxin [Planctomycetota bacterium]